MYRGLKWYKCDLHLHTPVSECFLDKEIEPESFLEKAKEKGLNIIAITDHDNSGWVDKIKTISTNYGITVFPGVELTVGDNRIHLLILFDVDKTDRDIQDFLMSIEMTREELGKKNTYVKGDLVKIIKKAQTLDCLVIPAHIDDFSGLNMLASPVVDDILNEKITAVQIVHKASNSSSDVLQESSYDDIKTINDDRNFKKIATLINKINKEKKISKLTFSDNPSEKDGTKHGIEGIGKEWTWIKMKENPNLESLKQSMNINLRRIKNKYEQEERPYKLPTVWIEKLLFSNTKINKDEVEINFSPQMTSIIGGRGTGKSSLFTLMRGLMNIPFKSDNIKKEINKIYSSREGILNENTLIKIFFYMEGDYYLLDGKGEEPPKLFKKNRDNERFILETTPDVILNRLKEQVEVYSQKEIFEIAKESESLIEIIDSDIKEVKEIKKDIEELEKEYIEKYSRYIRLKEKEKDHVLLKKEVEKDKETISEIGDSNYASLIKKEECNKNILKGLEELNEKIDKNLKTIEELQEIEKLSLEENIDTILNPMIKEINLELEKVEEIFVKIKEKKEVMSNLVIGSQWNKDKIQSSKELEELKKRMVELTGNSDISVVMERIEANSQKIAILESELSRLDTLEQEKETIIKKIREKREEIKRKRDLFLEKKFLGTEIKIVSDIYRAKDSFEKIFRKIIGKETEFESDITKLTADLNRGLILTNVDRVIEKLQRIEETEYSVRFKSLIKDLRPENVARINLILPNDELKITYEANSSPKLINQLSAGQRTSIVLSYLLSRGTTPLLLDQPEDDLDNKLICDLIVKGSLINKEKRQLIIITHNANIPVNGDSEWVVVMESNGKEILKKIESDIDDSVLVKEICEIMEGGKEAFKQRDSKYEIWAKEE